MAERLFKKILHSRGLSLEEWQVTSAGTWAEDGIPPDEKLVATMEAFNINVHDHRSRMLDAAIIADQELVLVMEDNHKEALCIEFPDHCDRVFLVSEMIGKHFEISDPFLGPLKAYQRTAKQLDQILTEAFERIVHIAQAKRR